MSTEKSYLSHLERTEQAPRDAGTYTVILRKIERVNPKIKTFRLEVENKEQSIEFQPGQWLDVICPGVAKVGGFTITSSPLAACAGPRRTDTPYVGLAVQASPENAPAAWLWRPEHEILGQALKIRVGGSFVWPPPQLSQQAITPASQVPVNGGGHSDPDLQRVVFIAGGVGINPLMSMLTHLHDTDSLPSQVHILYSTKLERLPAPSSPSLSSSMPSSLSSVPPSEVTGSSPSRPSPSIEAVAKQVLFFPQLAAIAQAHPGQVALELYGTGEGAAADVMMMMHQQHDQSDKNNLVPEKGDRAWRYFGRRLDHRDVLRALGSSPTERRAMACYVCGPPAMTDEMVEFVRGLEGVRREWVLCEKWW